MTTEDLRHRSLKVEVDFRKGVKKKDDYTDSMLKYHEWISRGECESDDHSYAFSAYEDNMKREIIESLLLADAEPEEVNELFGIEPKVLEIYRELFFDTDFFWNKLDKISYIASYKDEFGKELKMRALNLGPEFIYFKYANIVPRLTLRET